MKFLLLIFFAFDIQETDSTLLYKLHNTLECGFSDFFFENLTRTADSKALLGETLLFVTFGDSTEQRIARPLIVGAGINALTVDIIKYITNRERPTPPSTRTNSSFPSGHTAAAFFYATYLSHYYPRYQIPLYLWATGIGISRVYLKRHWPSDVVVGAILGFGMAKLTLHLSEKIENIHIF